MKKRIPLTLGAALLALLPAHSSFAVDYSWTATDGTGGPAWNWDDAGKWSPAGVPNAADANVSFSITGGSPSIALNGAYVVNNFRVTADGGRNVSFTTLDTAGSYSLAIGGSLSKNNGSSSVSFMDFNTGRSLGLTVNTLNFTNTGGGAFNFGRNDGGRRLSSLAIGSLDMGAADASTATLRFNISSHYSFGLATFSGTNTKNVYLISNASGSAGYSRTATVKGLVQTAGSTAATIRGSERAAESGSNAATLQIDVDAGNHYSADTVLTDGTGGSLAVRKTGAGTQALSGALTHTGGTEVEAGALVVTGSLSAAGDVSVASGATFVTGSALSVRTVSLQGGAILGFDLDAGASLSIGGDLLRSGEGGGSFVIDFRNSGLTDHAYGGILSVTGSAGAFAGQTIAFVNFGDESLGGSLTFAEITGGFTIAAVPEPSAFALLAGGAMLLASLAHRRRGR